MMYRTTSISQKANFWQSFPRDALVLVGGSVVCVHWGHLTGTSIYYKHVLLLLFHILVYNAVCCKHHTLYQMPHTSLTYS
jgi:hypothetical protein